MTSRHELWERNLSSLTSDAVSDAPDKGLGPARAGLRYFQTDAGESRVEGWYRPDLVGLRDAFIGLHAGRNEEPEIGSAVAVWQRDELVAELWGGWADEAKSLWWQEDTLVQIQSATKGLVALCIHILADRGHLDLDAPAATYWPEFAANGKGDIRVRHIMDQTSGLCFAQDVDPGDVLDHGAMVSALARQPALWPAGTRAGYQMITQGFLLAEILRRVDGRTLGRFLAEEISGPLRADCHIGLNDEQIRRCAEVVYPPMNPQSNPMDHASLAARALSGSIPGSPTVTQRSSQWRRAEVPAANGHATARGLARIYAALATEDTAGGARLLSTAALDTAVTEQHDMVEEVLGRHYRHALGFILESQPTVGYGGRPRTFGHHGMGGSLGFADRDGQLGFAYVVNRLHERATNGPRSTALIDAMYEVLR